MAFRRMHQRNAEGYQRWLRARVVAQGFTVIAIIVAGAGQWVKKTDDQGTVTRPSSEKETRAFESRLRAAEEAHAAETMLRTGTVVEPTTPITPPEPNTVNQDSSSSSPPPPKSSWSSWFGLSSRRWRCIDTCASRHLFTFLSWFNPKHISGSFFIRLMYLNWKNAHHSHHELNDNHDQVHVFAWIEPCDNLHGSWGPLHLVAMYVFRGFKHFYGHPSVDALLSGW